MKQSAPLPITVLAADGQSLCCRITSSTAPLTVEIKRYSYAKYRKSSRCLKHIAIPASICYEGQTYAVTAIGDRAFYSCADIATVSIPPSVTSIGDFAFWKCTNLTAVVVPPSVTRIGGFAFKNCRRLASITLPRSVGSIGENAFEGCTGLTATHVKAGNEHYRSLDGVLFNKDKTVLEVFPGGKTGVYRIPGSVTVIGEHAFSGCAGLTAVTVPRSVTSIGGNAFEGCTGLTAIHVNAGNEDYSSHDGVLFNKDQTILVAFPGGKTGLYCIPETVTIIDWWAFSKCTGSISVRIPPSVTEIGVGAFQHCTGLTAVSIPPSVTEIGDYAFEGCTRLTAVTIPRSVTEIGEHAFQHCSALCSITLQAPYPPRCGNGAFDGASKSLPVYVPGGSLAAYEKSKWWSGFINMKEKTDDRLTKRGKKTPVR
ncbi:MAG: leucine-rich repeat domain-containing protein [Prevotellaceae bacterium]|jgi:hypothetical protein|nr:leucine-rich repeat domain-containing protein [Prevotellaceae bacterium]